MDDRAAFKEMLWHEGPFQKQPQHCLGDLEAHIESVSDGADFAFGGAVNDLLLVLWETPAVLPHRSGSPGQLSWAWYHVVVGSGVYSVSRRRVSIMRISELEKTRAGRKLDMPLHGRLLLSLAHRWGCCLVSAALIQDSGWFVSGRCGAALDFWFG